MNKGFALEFMKKKNIYHGVKGEKITIVERQKKLSCNSYEKNNREDFIFTMLMYCGIISLLIFSGWAASKL